VATKTKPETYEDLWVPTTCCRCYNGCGIRVRRVNGVAVKIEGEPDSLMGGAGGLCAKGVTGVQMLYDPNRLSKPLRRTNPEKGLYVDPGWEEITWDEALTEITARLKKIIDDETILLSDQFFNKTLANLKANPKVAVTFWEGFEGYQLKGSIVIETSGQRFEETAKWIEDLGNKAGFPLKSKGAVILKIDEIYGVAPGPGAGKQLA